jgi:hypothetical protein
MPDLGPGQLAMGVAVVHQDIIQDMYGTVSRGGKFEWKEWWGVEKVCEGKCKCLASRATSISESLKSSPSNEGRSMLTTRAELRDPETISTLEFATNSILRINENGKEPTLNDTLTSQLAIAPLSHCSRRAGQLLCSPRSKSRGRP